MYITKSLLTSSTYIFNESHENEIESLSGFIRELHCRHEWQSENELTCSFTHSWFIGINIYSVWYPISFEDSRDVFRGLRAFYFLPWMSMKFSFLPCRNEHEMHDSAIFHDKIRLKSYLQKIACRKCQQNRNNMGLSINVLGKLSAAIDTTCRNKLWLSWPLHKSQNSK